MEKSSTKRESLSVSVFGMTGAFSILISLLILGFQALAWLKNDYWGKIAVWKIIPSTIEDAILRMEWLGVQKILLWTFDCELGLFLFAMGGALILISIGIAEQQ